MKPQHIITLVVVGLAIGGGAFYGGMQVAKANASPTAGRFPDGNMVGQRGTGTMPGGPSGRIAGGGSVANGEVLSKDDGSLTIKLQDGGSKIVFISASTTVNMMTEGSLDDVAPGSDVMIVGTADSSGNLTAKSVQLRPSGETPPPLAQ
ncbi:MAG: hypothetical protein V1745_00305 [Patescibacteria group bacterium]